MSSNGVHKGLPAGERSVRGQEENQDGAEESGPALQPAAGLQPQPAGESHAGDRVG